MTRFSLAAQGVAVALALWSWFAYAPPFSWFAEWQMSVMGVYSPKLALLCTVVLLALPLMGLAAFGTALMGRQEGESRLADFARSSPRLIAVLLAGVGLLAVGARDFVDSARIGDRCLPVTLASLVDGHTPESRWVELSDYIPDVDRAMALREGSSEHDFVPLAVTAPGEIPVVIADCSSYEVSSLELGSPLRGVLRADALPGEVRVAFEAAGLRRGSYWVLDVGDSPEERLTRGQIMAAIGALLFIGALFVCVRRWREI